MILPVLVSIILNYFLKIKVKFKNYNSSGNLWIFNDLFGLFFKTVKNLRWFL